MKTRILIPDYFHVGDDPLVELEVEYIPKLTTDSFTHHWGVNKYVVVEDIAVLSIDDFSGQDPIRYFNNELAMDAIYEQVEIQALESAELGGV